MTHPTTKVSEEGSWMSPRRNTTVQLSTAYTNHERQNTQRLDRQIDRQMTVSCQMPIAKFHSFHHK